MSDWTRNSKRLNQCMLGNLGESMTAKVVQVQLSSDTIAWSIRNLAYDSENYNKASKVFFHVIWKMPESL